MSAWHLDILRKREGGFTLCVLTADAFHFETEMVASSARRDVLSGLQRIAQRIGRPQIVHTDHAYVWNGLPAAIGASHRVCKPGIQTRLSLLERRMRTEDRQ